MRKFINNFLFLGLITASLFACNPQSPVAQSVENTQFEVNFKGNGTAFYAIDGNTGQLSFMLNYGQDAGKWQKYGNVYRNSGTSKLFFKAIERTIGSSFYILNGKSGQLSFMLDYGPGAGSWVGFGNPLGNVPITEFETNNIADGVIFYVYDGQERQLYFMQDFGKKAGVWLPYGKDKN